jgi:hypothetical protein
MGARSFCQHPQGAFSHIPGVRRRRQPQKTGGGTAIVHGTSPEDHPFAAPGPRSRPQGTETVFWMATIFPSLTMVIFTV